ncbi:MAG TPA: 5-oxoprolinase subunit PxpB [Vicinamibacterales bacterium]
MIPPRLSRLGELGWLVAFEPRLDPAVNAHVLALAARLRDAAIPGVRDIVPAVASLAVHVERHEDAVRAGETIAQLLAESAEPPPDAAAGRLIELPVRYGGADGPDLADVAAECGLEPRDVVRRHVEAEYRVFMLGFLPGFPYLGVVNPAIQVSRRAEPRARVPAGAVGLAGPMTGVYPVEGPGGWRIIGRTPVRLFEPDAPRPALLQPGDRVRFVPVDIEPATHAHRART